MPSTKEKSLAPRPASPSRSKSRAENPPREGVPATVQQVLKSPGEPLDAGTRQTFETRFGHDFSRVRVHSDAEAANSVNASAFTVKNHIVFGEAQITTNSDRGRQLLAHELTHVVQQERANDASQELGIGPVDGGLEAEAQNLETASRPAVNLKTDQAILQRDGLPVATFSPAPGLLVDRKAKSISITGTMELSGPEATAARAAAIQSSINSIWTRSFPDGCSVTCNIKVNYRAPESKPGNAAQIVADKISGPSHVNAFGTPTMTLNANEADAFQWTPAHEFGHVIGLKDRYSESIISSIKGSFGGQRTTTVEEGYQGNLMAQDKGALEGKNVKDVAEATAPSKYWIHDDDQVRDWVTQHSPAEIGSLSTADKITSIHTLMGGWVSDDDVVAITRICHAVTQKTEADAIRKSTDLSDFSSLGQRTSVRVAFASMP